jgi:RNA polymerase sigma-70 factor (ECF subfamily)
MDDGTRSAVEPKADDYERFYDEHRQRLVGQAFVLTGNLQEAQDLAQETLVRVWQHWGKVAAYDDPGAWARHVLHRLAVSNWRSTTRRRLRSVPSRGSDVAAPDAGHLDVLAALARLPMQQRRAIVLHELVGLSTDEVAAEMKAPAGTVRSWISQARAQLAADLGFASETPSSAVGGA